MKVNNVIVVVCKPDSGWTAIEWKISKLKSFISKFNKISNTVLKQEGLSLFIHASFAQS